MARRPSRRPPAASGGTRNGAGATANPPSGSDRERAVAAFMQILAEKPFETIGMGEVARRANVSLADLRGLFGSPFAILAAFTRDIDRQVLAGGDADMAEEPARERLFDVLMRRIDALTPHKSAIESLMHSARRNPPLALALNALTVRSQQWMLTAADISATGPMGRVRAQGLAVLFASVLDVWLRDDDPDLARTMATLDRGLTSGGRWLDLLDDLCRIPAGLCRLRPRRRRSRYAEEDDAPAAA